MLAVQTRHQFKNHFAGTSIKIASRLISEQDLRLSNQSSSQRQPLLFAARQFAGTMMPAFLQSHFG